MSASSAPFRPVSPRRRRAERARPRYAALVLLIALAGCVAPGSTSSGVKGGSAASALPTFGPSVVVDPDAVGREPSLAIAPDGTIYICSLRGLGRGTDLWRSLDGGTTFEFAGSRLHPSGPAARSGSGDLGGGDCDVAVDAGGRVYLVDLWVGSASLAWSDDRGASWTGSPFSLATGTVDRPWALGRARGEVFVTGVDIHGTLPEHATEMAGAELPAVGGVWVARSTDGGRFFRQQVLAVPNEDRFPTSSNLAAGGGNLYLHYTKRTGERHYGHYVAVSKDRGATWTHHLAATQSWDPNVCAAYPLVVFPVVAADEAGGVYLAWAGVHPETRRVDLFFSASRDGGEHWNPPVLVTSRAGTRFFPWMVAGDAGRVALAWYEGNATLYPEPVANLAERATCSWNPKGRPVDWFVHFAITEDAFAPAPAFLEDLVHPQPVHRGPDLDRPYAELLQVEFDPSGRAAVAFVADGVAGPARPMFALQGTGPLGRSGPSSPPWSG